MSAQLRRSIRFVSNVSIGRDELLPARLTSSVDASSVEFARQAIAWGRGRSRLERNLERATGLRTDIVERHAGMQFAQHQALGRQHVEHAKIG